MRKIKTINGRDIEFLNGLRVSGVCNLQLSLNIITANRLKTFELNHIIERCRATDGTEIYRFTDKAKAWVTKNVPQLADHSYYRSNSYKHDLALFERYINLSSTQRKSVLAEAEIRDKFREHLENLREQDISRYNLLSEQLRTHEISMPDMCYMSNGHEVYFEVTTSAYGTAELAAKEAFASEMGATIEYHKI